MSKLIALMHFLLALAGCSLGVTSYSDRIAIGKHEVLVSSARVQDGIARFECERSDSGWCHYTLYPDACFGTGCTSAPMQRFSIALGQSRQIAGLTGFHPCVATTTIPLDPRCRPVATTALR